MPSYYNPYTIYPASYPGAMTAVPQPSFYAQQAMSQPQQSYTQPATFKAMEWVEGEVGAKAFQMPAGWPANQPIPLWDSTDTVIFLKSWSPMGIPNPMQKLRYEMPETQGANMLQSGATAADYVTKDDLKVLRDEIQSLKDSMANRKNQNGSNNQSGQNMNRGGNNNV